jgi:predicted Zn-dependent protease
LVDDEAINAISFPGGPMYVNSGLLEGAANESEVAGVLAHEMSHIALRHGAANEKKAQGMRAALQVAGLAAGLAGIPMAGPAINMGGNLGVKSMVNKYSRDSERDADLNGARMMAAAGYDPAALAHFLERLSQPGATKTKVWERMQADHPDAAQRAQSIREDIRFYPPKTYEAATGRFVEIQAAVTQLSAGVARPAAAQSTADGTRLR